MNLPPIHPIDFESLEWEYLAPGLRQCYYLTGEDRFRLLEISDQFVETDWCKKAHRGYVLTGTLFLHFPNRVQAYPQGTELTIPAEPDSWHKAYVPPGNQAIIALWEPE